MTTVNTRFRSPLRRFLRLALTLLALHTHLHAGPAENAAEVERIIATGTRGNGPVLWFARDAERNLGSGHSTWAATSGGRLSERGLDPWGRANSAFGLARGAVGGAAVSGSKAYSPINPKGGSIVLFCRPSSGAKPPLLLFSNADWGAAGYLSLRINAVNGRLELTLASSDPGTTNKARQTSFATLYPGRWSFVALSWQEAGSQCVFRYWAGSLDEQELTYGELEAPPIAESKSMFLIAGRRADDQGALGLPSLAFEGGLISQFAVFDTPLSEDVVQRLFVASTRP
ncbi:MAG: hypothetical protein MUE42_08985 [Opitutaceae bacterium]|jgi:hypothetical protein|nr:hypothetical protein [Opitutaceae bacterium]